MQRIRVSTTVDEALLERMSAVLWCRYAALDEFRLPGDPASADAFPVVDPSDPSAFWDRNYFVESLPLVGAFLTNNFVRGAVSGLGLVNVLAALGELAVLFGGRGSRQPSPEEPGTDSLPHH